MGSARELAGESALRPLDDGRVVVAVEGIVEIVGDAAEGRRTELLRAAYVNALRNDATVINYLADRIVESQGKVTPALTGK